ncbi:MAG: hypothetical protein UT06_C0011G0009 [Candidatus Woesebacteria bacterium GW2011_GWA1_38_8]|uniref:Uncharacterized protein n=1 Tax=Candidatus Woesebacteria bacterium GW2011_GWA1_38_8 TaxID=1618547 RepID=A0A0G0L811_9BACT|nr:MAG: hypothetical protein UT06_C0011G0009 [Candidatus Woesebacteria bacterium GW2011_GWA1_38_8]
MGREAAVKNPAKIRVANSQKIFGERANPIKENAVPIKLIKIMGFLPTLSDSLPHIGEKINCMKENDPAIRPIVNADAPKLST